MKYTLVSMIFLLYTCGWSQVKSKEPLTLKSSVQSITFWGNNSAWLMSSSSIVRTTDGGATRTLVSGERIGEPTHCSFINEREGWSVTRKGDVWKTQDGGLNWKYVANVVPNREPIGMAAIKQFLFTDAMNGWVLTPFDLLTTSDGGVTWKEWTSGFADHVQFVNNKVGWIDDKDDGSLYKTVDGGKTWQPIARRISGKMQGFSFIDGNQGWICSVRNGDIFYTGDGGRSWTRQTLPTPGLSLTSIQFLNENEGWITGHSAFVSSSFQYKSVLLHTINGGRNWVVEDTVPIEGRNLKIHFSNVQQGWLYTETSLYRTTDRGNSWSLVLTYPKRTNVHNY